MRAIWWGAARHLPVLRQAATLDMVVRPFVDSWQRRQQVQLSIYDVRVEGATPNAYIPLGAGQLA